jgi:hypothetical protein
LISIKFTGGIRGGRDRPATQARDVVDDAAKRREWSRSSAGLRTYCHGWTLAAAVMI